MGITKVSQIDIKAPQILNHTVYIIIVDTECIVKSTRGEATCEPARGWGTAVVVHVGVRVMRGPGLVAAD